MDNTSKSLCDSHLVAPCGLNCGVCRAHLRQRNPCPGCRGGEANKSNACLACAIKHCSKPTSGEHPFCFTCTDFPCAKLSHLDDRYQTRYGLSVIANLARIKAVGLEKFTSEEDAKWRCSNCGSQLCMHASHCGTCGKERDIREI